jgi:Transposase DDE domain group 1
MPNCTQETANHIIEFGRLGRRVVEGQFDGASMTSDAGVMLLGATDRKLGLMQAVGKCIADPRSPLLITHSVAELMRQRVYGLALGWEDLNDHSALHCAVTWPCKQLLA